MLRPLYILKRLAVLALGVAFAAGAQTQPSKSTPQAPAKNAPTAAAPAKSPPQAAAPAKAPSKSAAPAKNAPTAAAPAKSPPQAAAPAKAPSKSAAPAKAPAKSAAPAKAAQAAKAPAPKPAVAQKPSKPPKAPAKAAEKPKKEEPPTVASLAGHRRDPFLALISARGDAPIRLPPGKAGLQVSTVRVDGIVRSQNGMIVVVTNPQGRTYFLHQGDRLFDGRVEQISMDAVTFKENGKDPFGNAIERTVVKRIYPTAGEQQ